MKTKKPSKMLIRQWNALLRSEPGPGIVDFLAIQKGVPALAERACRQIASCLSGMPLDYYEKVARESTHQKTVRTACRILMAATEGCKDLDRKAHIAVLIAEKSDEPAVARRAFEDLIGTGKWTVGMLSSVVRHSPRASVRRRAEQELNTVFSEKPEYWVTLLCDDDPVLRQMAVRTCIKNNLFEKIPTDALLTYVKRYSDSSIPAILACLDGREIENIEFHHILRGESSDARVQNWAARRVATSSPDGRYLKAAFAADRELIEEAFAIILESTDPPDDLEEVVYRAKYVSTSERALAEIISRLKQGVREKGLNPQLLIRIMKRSRCLNNQILARRALKQFFSNTTAACMHALLSTGPR